MSDCNITGFFAFTCEQRYWPLVHFIIPFLVWRYTRSIPMQFLLITLWESLEAWISGATGDIIIFVPDNVDIEATTETVGDSLCGDILMGALGTFASMGVCFYFDIPRWLPPRIEGHWAIYFKYLFQVIVYAAPTTIIQLSFPGGNFSSGQAVMIFWIPAWHLVFSQWNQADGNWRYVEGPEDPKTGGRSFFYVRVSFPDGEAQSTAVCVSGILFVFISAFLFRFLSVFFMALIYGGLFLAIIWTCYFVFVLPFIPKGALTRCDKFVMLW